TGIFEFKTKTKNKKTSVDVRYDSFLKYKNSEIGDNPTQEEKYKFLLSLRHKPVSFLVYSTDLTIFNYNTGNWVKLHGKSASQLLKDHEGNKVYNDLIFDGNKFIKLYSDIGKKVYE